MWTQISTALLVGLLSAFAFQLLLTSIGVAFGLSVLSFQSTPSTTETEIASSGSRMGGIAGFGVLITINTVLFGACFIAVRFSQVDDPASGAIAGLVIWSAYLLILTWLSSAAVSTLVASGLGVLTGGFHQLMTTIAAALKGQDEPPLTQEQAIAIVQQEIQRAFAPEILNHLLYLSENQHLQPAPPIPFASEKRPHDLTLEEVIEQEENSQVSDRSIHTLEKTVQFWPRFESYLYEIDVEQRTPEQIQSKLAKWLHETLEATSDSAHWPTFDRSKLKAILKQRKKLTKKQRQHILELAEATWDQTVEKLNHSLSNPLNTSDTDLDESTADNNVELIDQQDSLQQISIASLAIGIIQNQLTQIDWGTVFDHLSPPYLDDMHVEQVVANVQSTVHDILDQPQQWSEDEILAQVGSLRNQIIQHIDRVQHAIHQQVSRLRTQAQQRLDHTRKAAAVAAWWLSATALTAGITAAIAGALAAGWPIHLRP